MAISIAASATQHAKIGASFERSDLRLSGGRTGPDARTMAYIITEPCIDVKDGDCTAACPVDCIYEGGRMFYIHPDECINCGLCLSICPVDAIVWDGELPASMKLFEAVNGDFFGDAVTGWGSPGGWDAAHTTRLDHPAVAAWPPRRAAVS